MNYRQIHRVLETLTDRGYQKDLINWWLKRDIDIIEEQLNIPLSDLND